MRRATARRRSGCYAAPALVPLRIGSLDHGFLLRPGGVGRRTALTGWRDAKCSAREEKAADSIVHLPPVWKVAMDLDPGDCGQVFVGGYYIYKPAPG
jgi:hypothetical protein